MINNLNILLPEIFLTLSIFSILMLGVFIKRSFNLVFNLSSIVIIVTIAIILNTPNNPKFENHWTFNLQQDVDIKFQMV